MYARAMQHIEINETDSGVILGAALSSSRQLTLTNLPRQSDHMVDQLCSKPYPWAAALFELSSARQPLVGLPSQDDTKRRTEEIEARFRELCAAWKSATRISSFSSSLAMHPAYQRIIGLGTAAVPLILAELEKDLDQWFWALKAITGEDPVPPESRGKMREMADAWLNWGRKKGDAW